MVHEDADKFPDLRHVAQLQDLLGHGLQKRLLGLRASQVAIRVAGRYAIGTGVVMAVADHAHGLLPVEDLEALLQVDVQVLVGVVIVHIPGHVEFHAAYGVHQLPHSLPLNDDVEVRDNASEIPHLGLQSLDPAAVLLAGVIDGVDLLGRPGHIHRRIPGNAHHVHLIICHIIGYQNQGVRIPAAAGVPTNQQEGVVILFPPGGSLRPLALLRLPAAGLYAGAVVLADVRGPDKGGPYPRHDQRQGGDGSGSYEGGLFPSKPLPLLFSSFCFCLLLKGITAGMPPAPAGLMLSSGSAHGRFPFK